MLVWIFRDELSICCGAPSLIIRGAPMSKWALLKASLVTKRRDSDSSASIHRFNGFDTVSRRKLIWPGFSLHIDEDPGSSCEALLAACCAFMASIDCTECLLHVHLSADHQGSRAYLDEIAASPYVRAQSRSEVEVALFVRHPTLEPRLSVCEYWAYSLPLSLPQPPASAPSNLGGDLGLAGLELCVYTRERPRETGVTVADLFSHRLHDVDNTGNIRVWPAEPLLLRTLLTVPRFRALAQGQRVLELGGGMTALAGLGLAVAGLCAHVALTDGHPDCVQNQAVGVEMCRQRGCLPPRNAASSCSGTGSDNQRSSNSNISIGISGSSSTSVSASLLHWSPASNAPQVAALTQKGLSLFGLVLAADCLFFEAFHAQLLLSLQNLLARDGVALFLQPRRAGSMQRFLALCAEGPFEAEVVEDYCPDVSSLRAGYLAEREQLGYDEDIHYPLLVLLRWRKSEV